MSDRRFSVANRLRVHRAPIRHRRGVILLIVMVLLALMALMGLTLVLVTAQGRLSALAGARHGLQSDHDDKELAAAITQVIVGSNDPNSSAGAHGLLEDLYGTPQFFGQIAPPALAGPSVYPIGETTAGANVLAGGNNGTLLQLVIIPGNVNASTGVATASPTPQSLMQYLLPQSSGAFCGQLVTMLTGNAAGHTARVVGYYFNPAFAANVPMYAVMQVSSFGGVVPAPGDQFMVNGRPYSGTGFGLDLTKFQGGAPWIAPTPPTAATSGGNVPLLTAIENVLTVVGPSYNMQASSNPTNPALASWGMPYAYMPNHARLSVTTYSPAIGGGTYWDIAGPGGANEAYDAPDYQNLMLAMHYWSASSNLPNGSVITPVPSLHRPELVGWFYSQSLGNPALGIAANPAISMANPAMRRKVILRPEPSDHYFNDTNGNGVWDAREPFHDVNGNGFYDVGDVYTDGSPAFLDLNHDKVWTAGETDYSGNTFNPVTGCWFIAQNGGWSLDTNAGLDFDNDSDGINDSIWADFGLPVKTESDGTLSKNLVAVLCIDLDGKANLNAHGTLAQLDYSRYPYNNAANPWNTALPANTLSGPVNAAGSTTTYNSADYNQRILPVGQGYGPADVNLLQIFFRSHGPAAALNYYKTFLQGYDGYTVATGAGPIAPVDGRNGESTRLTIPTVFPYPGVYPPGSWGNSPTAPTVTQSILGGPRPGWSQWFDPYATAQLVASGFTAYWVNDPVALVRFSDIRPGLLSPPSASATPFFFDFLDDYLPGASGLGSPHLPTGHGSPSDLHSRGFLTTDLSGRPYYAGTIVMPWQDTGQAQAWQPGITYNWQATMNDAAAFQYSGLVAGVAGEVTLNEGVDTQYEMNLTQNARQAGQNTGNSVNNIADYATIDVKIAPSEYEAIVRSHDRNSGTASDTKSLGQRLDSLDVVATGSATTKLGVDKVRLAVTSESWDLPTPNLNLTPRQIQDVIQFVNYYQLTGGSWLGNSNALNLNSISLVDLFRARILADNYDPVSAYPNPNFPNLSVLSGADVGLFGNLRNTQQGVATFPAFPVWPLLAPETILGQRFDVNRLLGNGVDDNGNGVVDDPLEVFWQVNNVGEALQYPYSTINTANVAPAGQINPVTQLTNQLGVLDLNNDGFYAISPLSGTASIDPQLSAQTATQVFLPGDPTSADARARQLLAKQLYCLMMLLLDDRPYFTNPLAAPGTDPAPPQAVRAQIFNAAGAIATKYLLQSVPYAGNLGATGGNVTGLPDYLTLSGMPREQAAYVIAQWAINVVDFRDRDSIMTPFEFDIYPFRADPYVPPAGNPNGAAVQAAEWNLTWNVDDIVDPYFGVPLPYSHMDDSQAYRGLVWGCERPELLMTETAAFHDRGTADTASAQAIYDQADYPANPSGPDTKTGTGGPPQDIDFDQVRRPRGSLIVELFNPTNYWDPPQFDMQTTTAAPQPWAAPDMNGNRGTGVNLAQVASVPSSAGGPTSSPVWRIVVAYSPWQPNEQQCYGTAPAGTVAPVGGGGWSASPQGSGQQLDTRAPVLPPGAIHRAVYFTPFQPVFVNGGGAALSNTSVVGDTLLNSSFFADPDVFTPMAGVSPQTLLLPPGQYALVGPATKDIAGTGNYYIFAGQNASGGAATNSNPFKLRLAGSLPGYNTIAQLTNATLVPQGPYGGAGATVPLSTTIKPVIGVPIQTNWYQSAAAAGPPVYAPHNSTAVTGANTNSVYTTLRMSLSEPEHGYPIWQAGACTPQTVPLTGAAIALMQDDAMYYSSTGTPAAGMGPFPQHPFDSGQGQPTGTTSPFPPYLQFTDQPNPYVAPGGTTQSATLGYTVLYLQRLANPLQTWDAKLNPYITVDSMPVDLTSYTGEWTTAEMATTYNGGVGMAGPNNPNPTGAAGPWTAMPGASSTFDSRRRGYSPTTGAVFPVPNVWTPLPTTGPNVYAGGGYGLTAGSTFANPMPVSSPGTSGSSLGWVNYEYTLGVYYVGGAAPVGTSGMPSYMYNGDPIAPFPWYAWNNRPFVSQYELMLVPASSPSSQALDFGMLGWQSSGASSLSEYTPGQPAANMLPVAQFANLLNFFDVQQTPALAGGTTSYLPNLYRVFEFLQVPSRYTGTQDMLDPSQFAGANSVYASQGPLGVVSHQFHTPFNWLSRYREPGRINLNTIFDPIVFKALMDDYPGTLYGVGGEPWVNPNVASLWQQMVYSRQGLLPDAGRTLAVSNINVPPNPISQFAFNPTGLGSPGINSDVPTYFANPFRPDGANAFVPQTSAYNPALSTRMQLWNYPAYATLPTQTSTPVNNAVNTTLLRESSTATNFALFDDTAFDTTNPSTTTYTTAVTGATGPYPFRDAARNAAFQYQMFTRLGNTTTNRSNVYAIWVTLGKFQVQQVGVSPSNPDGYKLVAPVMDDTGKQVVTRGFYIFDRSIPMGFQRGQDLNIENGFLVERVLQQSN